MVLLLRLSPGDSSRLILPLILVGIFLGMGYTAPPLQFSYRGLGELVVGLTHSFYLVLCGYAFQTGTILHPSPWLLSIPLFFSILAANTLAGIPDYQADKAVSKRSLPVLLGPRISTMAAAGFVCLAVLSGVFFWYFEIIPKAASKMILIVIPHGLILLLALFKLTASRHYDRRINGLMTLSLSFIIWFGLIPLISLLQHK
jgi:1,4-dihydroxy-2-naphthoate octaprenyltransferase